MVVMTMRNDAYENVSAGRSYGVCSLTHSHEGSSVRSAWFGILTCADVDEEEVLVCECWSKICAHFSSAMLSTMAFSTAAPFEMSPLDLTPSGKSSE